MDDDRRAMVRSWAALAMCVVGVAGAVVGLVDGGRVFSTVCSVIVGVCGAGLLVVAHRERGLRFRGRR